MKRAAENWNLSIVRPKWNKNSTFVMKRVAVEEEGKGCRAEQQQQQKGKQRVCGLHHLQCGLLIRVPALLFSV